MLEIYHGLKINVAYISRCELVWALETIIGLFSVVWNVDKVMWDNLIARLIVDHILSVVY
jgi:hypothetical protein